MSRPTICLTMIVKDEAEVLPRALASVRELCDTWVICDTGSTDGTPEVIHECLAGVPGRLYRHAWRNYGRNRTLACQRAKGVAAWQLHLDADQELVGADDTWLPWVASLGAEAPDCYYVDQLDADLRYSTALLVRGDLDWRYVGATHEYLDDSGRRYGELPALKLVHHGDGGNRDTKLATDLELLRPGYLKGDPRDTFYYAETLRYAGQLEAAVEAYDLRAEMAGTWEEERWYAQYQAARLSRSLPGLLAAWHARPWRHEPLSAMARLVAESPEVGDRLFKEPLGGFAWREGEVPAAPARKVRRAAPRKQPRGKERR